MLKSYTHPLIKPERILKSYTHSLIKPEKKQFGKSLSNGTIVRLANYPGGIHGTIKQTNKNTWVVFDLPLPDGRKKVLFESMVFASDNFREQIRIYRLKQEKISKLKLSRLSYLCKNRLKEYIQINESLIHSLTRHDIVILTYGFYQDVRYKTDTLKRWFINDIYKKIQLAFQDNNPSCLEEYLYFLILA
ncbi:MAG: hypothetical protein F6K54_29895 [Okeania sp. SIO3B5]|uniref:hypothetical protein n=1 Tax=Okeania sp. SIO3B5 TaxID=2607811 RepID=UPI001400CD86|nr:hypothetical protein [Okeania sp. SIO3B5]NEO56916.1 hypothetical protein [Okeania sp. SIO3B5]